MTAIVWKLVEQLVYRREVGTKHEHFPIAKRLAEADDAKRKRASRPQKSPTSLPSSVEDLLLKNARGHLVERSSDFGAIVVPERMDGNMNLEVRSLQESMHQDEALGMDALDGHSFRGLHPCEEGPSIHAFVYRCCSLCVYLSCLHETLFCEVAGLGEAAAAIDRAQV